MTTSKWLSLGIAWLAALGCGLWNMLQYELTPADISCPDAVWPADSVLRYDTGRPTLVMFLHPRCPCSRASLEELAILTARSSDRVSCRLVFLKPAGFPEGWEQTDLWRTAEGIPHARVYCDNENIEATRFRAGVSGETFLYDREGRLLFHGGVTASRGHQGDNVGRAAIELLVAGKPCATRETPVFGCSLRERSDELSNSSVSNSP